MGIQSSVNAGLGGLAALVRFSPMGETAANKTRYRKEKRDLENKISRESAINAQAKQAAAGKYNKLKQQIDNGAVVSNDYLKAANKGYIEASNITREQNIKNTREKALLTGASEDIEAAGNALGSSFADKAELEEEVKHNLKGWQKDNEINRKAQEINANTSPEEREHLENPVTPDMEAEFDDPEYQYAMQEANYDAL